ncbi:prepilin-type N-terminal cleavage/methylation domain-containing protein [Halobacteriovorax sp. GB3]|uniref:pilus assembly FimT family protein n=1 Tax=Halobacteriovorax sp. GB3 TaxID=2719615 RepID=UPI00235ECB17|nr:prepilin-type N-terminal cleavage/methylation domain-containing protein [Halobacteriovorax sp. GB3]MDD0852298.1 prepilin-type N-terminal cleavage/methylation domain-containing protein [Halobacteriovorax sp. GB3]
MNKFVQNKQGFTLIEILVALAILALTATMMIGFFDTDRAELDKAASTLEKAVALSESEAIYRNSFTRIFFDLKSDTDLEYSDNPVILSTPQIYTVQYGTDSKITIDPELFQIDEDEDDEELLALSKKQEQNFQPLPELEEGKVEIASTVRIFSIGSSLLKSNVTEGKIALYTFPNGEKDAGIIILGTTSELVSLTIEPFSSRTERRYYDIRGKQIEEIREIVEGIYNEWLKK